MAALASPVPTRIRLLRFPVALLGWMAIAPKERVGWSSVNGVQVTAEAVGLAALVDRHTPPKAPPT